MVIACRVKKNFQIPWWLTAGCNERVTDVYAYILVLTGVAMSGDQDQFCCHHLVSKGCWSSISLYH